MASHGWRRSIAPAGIMRPHRKKCSAPQSKSWNEKETSYFLAAASRTRFPCGITSTPTPSPAITAIVKVLMARSRFSHARPGPADVIGDGVAIELRGSAPGDGVGFGGNLEDFGVGAEGEEE